MNITSKGIFLFPAILCSFFLNSLFAQGFYSAKAVGHLVVKSQSVEVRRNTQNMRVSGGLPFVVQTGDKITTSKDGKAQLKLSTGDMIFLGPSTELIVTKDLVDKKSGKGKVSSFILNVWGKVRSIVQKNQSRKIEVRTPTAHIGVKGTDFVVEYVNDKTTVGTKSGLVNMNSTKNSQNIDIPPGKMSSVSPLGEVAPLSEFAGRLLEGVEFAGAQMKEADFAGGKVKQ